ncbi:Zinc finger DNA binding protein [Operophtera brumata]|uniref:Zinc finger DNA binding protein n=1 Tax=Operophtera brumata TaxID=104452 RepID=A0A0L7LF48_OPEBR|nr:Zinc finger DNA binding protein [Operophtera brumata]
MICAEAEVEMNCTGCRSSLTCDDHPLKCHCCGDGYHSECVNIKPHEYSKLTPEYLATWRCPSCCNVTRRERSNLDTPVRRYTQVCDISVDISSNMDESLKPESSNLIVIPTSQSETEFATFAQVIYGQLQDWRNENNENLFRIRDDIKCSLSELRDEIRSLKAEQTGIRTNLSVLNRDVSQLKESVQYCSGEHEQLSKRIEDVATASRSVEASPAIASLEAKLDSLEQQARQCNLELCNVPEKRNENLQALISNIGAALNVSIPSQDIISIHRVPQAQLDGRRPKNIIVKFTTRIMRDNVLGAYRRAKTLKSDQLHIAGTPARIYLNEHLTLKHKRLFRMCREMAKNNHFKYVWIRHSSILVRERDDAPAIVIRTESDLGKIKSLSNNG